VGACLLSCVLPPIAHAQLFQPAAAYNSIAVPTAVVTADFNGDGKLDLAVAGVKNPEGTPELVGVLLGRGDGSFAEGPQVAIGTTFVADMRVTDVNGDGKPDLVVLYQPFSVSAPSGFTVLLGRGDGSFLPPLTAEVGFAPNSLAIADCNGDGKLDVVLVDSLAQHITVQFGNGDGTFRAGPSTATNDEPLYVAAGDFNRDHKADLVVAFQSGVAEVRLGNGDGTFSAPTLSAHARPESTQALLVKDLDGDGALDFATGSDQDKIVVLRGNGDGTFQMPVEIALGYSVNALVAGDFNGDGKLDLATANVQTDYSVLFGNGDGTFQQPLSAGKRSFSVATSDFNGDGKSDLAVASAASSGVQGLAVLITNAAPQLPHFSAAVRYPVGRTPQALAIRDLNRDGIPDIAVANATDNSVTILLGTGGGSFRVAGTFATAPNPESIVIGDFDGDGKPDVACSSITSLASGISLLLGNGDGSFQPARTVTAPAGPLSAADFNRDGKLDLATSAPAADFNGDGIVDMIGPFSSSTVQPAPVVGFSLLLGNGDGTFQAPVAISGAVPNDARIGPRSFPVFGSVDLFLGRGDATFSASSVTVAGGTGGAGGTVSSVNAKTAGDFNNDGKADLVLTTFQLQGNTGFPGWVATWTSGSNPGAATALPVSAAMFTGFSGGARDALAVADFNLDGQVDAVVASYYLGFDPFTSSFVVSDSLLSFYLNQHGDTLLNAASIGFGGALSAVAAADLNGDDRPDVIVAEPDTNTIAVLLNQTPAPNPQLALSATSLTLPAQLVGATSAATNVTVNPGFTAVALGTIATSGDFAQTNNCPATLARNTSCTVQVTFRPTAGGARTGTLTIASNAVGAPHRVALSGTGMEFQLGAASGTQLSATVAAGQPANYSLALSAVGGFNGSVALSCSGAPPLADCTTSPNSLSLSGTSPASVSVTVTTTRGRAIAPARGAIAPAGAAGILLLTLLRRRMRRAVRWTATLVAMLALSVGCGGGSSSSSSSITPIQGTPAGSYTVVVTATSGGLARSVNLALTVQ